MWRALLAALSLTACSRSEYPTPADEAADAPPVIVATIVAKGTPRPPAPPAPQALAPADAGVIAAFDQDAARRALYAADLARRSCSPPLKGEKVDVGFATSGIVDQVNVMLSSPAYAHRACITKAFYAAVVPPFSDPARGVLWALAP